MIQQFNCKFVSIDCNRRLETDQLGHRREYSKLVHATGTTPHVPNIDGVDQAGIYTFRSLGDAEKLVARRARSRRAIVLGGGLLGLEAARGLQKYNTDVTIVEHAARLMSQQLDDPAAALLREHLMSSGLRVVLGDSVKRVIGDGRIKGVELRSGRRIACDTMVISTGTRPNLRLALDAGISVGRGIRVNDRMQTSDKNVFAVGECAEHRDRIYGLVAPGLEQAGVAAHCILGGDSHYTGSMAAMRLKAVGVNVFSAGRSGEQDAVSGLTTLSWRSVDNSCYRKLLLKRNRLAGVVAYGDWDETNRAQELVQRSGILWPWQRRRFLSNGRLWPEQEAVSVLDWPANAVVCQCTSVTRGTLGKALQDGHCSVEALKGHTGASSVCGSCRPLLSELAGATSAEAEPGGTALVWTGLAALLAALAVLFAPALPFADSVQSSVAWDQIWRNSLIKQITGYGILGLAVIISVISVRKRSGKLNFGSFASWRVFHVIAGVLVAALLIAHTGFRLGHNLNLYLMLGFAGLLLVGAVAGGVIGLQHALPRHRGRRLRTQLLRAHIFLLWPLPALLGFHIFKSYWF